LPDPFFHLNNQKMTKRKIKQLAYTHGFEGKYSGREKKWYFHPTVRNMLTMYIEHLKNKRPDLTPHVKRVRIAIAQHNLEKWPVELPESFWKETNLKQVNHETSTI
jgi:hypothetical protein